MSFPTPPRSRIAILDVLRGFALLGIFVVNFSLDVPWTRDEAVSLTPELDQWVAPAVQFWISDKFRAIFAALFGVSFALQSASSRMNEGFNLFYFRRMVWLLLIGIGNRLLRGSDILHGYAMLGVLLLPMQRLSDRTLLLTAAGLKLFPWHLASGVFQTTEQARPPIQAGAGLTEIVLTHGQDLFVRAFQFDPWAYWIGDVFPLFLIGYWVGRQQLCKASLDGLNQWRVAGLVFVGALLMNITAPLMSQASAGPLSEWAAQLFRDSGTMGLAAGYVLAVAIVFEARPDSAALQALAATGRMALTNYLLQSLLFVVIFFGVGLGLYAQLGVTAGVLIATAGFPIQVWLSRWWLTNYRFGPMEWVWRALSYRTSQIRIR